MINGGTVTAAACSTSGDAGIDASTGITINGGTVMAFGNMYDPIDGGDQTYVVFSFASRQTGGETYTLQNADGETVGTWTPANDFTYLVMSSPDLTAGDYTLWQGDTQQAGSASEGMGGPGAMGGGQPGGGAPPADGEAPADAPELPEGAEPPSGGEVPEGEESLAGEGAAEGEGPPPDVPERPEGEEPPAGGRPEDGTQSAAELSETFPLTEGGNFFTGIAPLETTEDTASDTAET